MDKEQENSSIENNRIFQQAQQRLAEQNASQPQRRKPGPQTGHTVEITKTAIVVGRNKTPVPPDEVEHMASLGCPDREIANYFGVKEDTLRRSFAEYLLKGRSNIKMKLRQAQIRAALEGNVVMLIWLGKNLLSQSDSGAANEDNRPLPWTDTLDDDVVDEDDVTDVEIKEELI